MSKKGTVFCQFDKIEKNGIRIFDRLKRLNYFKGMPKDKFINEFTDLYCELNCLHAFREGNGRIQRLFLNLLLKELTYSIDWSEIDSDLIMIATIKSVSGDIFMLKDIFTKSIKF